MKRTSWILASMAALMVAACESGRDAGAGGAGTETGSPGMAADTAMAPGAGAMDTAPADTAATGTDTAAH